jgi:hypothetical protein
MVYFCSVVRTQLFNASIVKPGYKDMVGTKSCILIGQDISLYLGARDFPWKSRSEAICNNLTEVYTPIPKSIPDMQGIYYTLVKSF